MRKRMAGGAVSFREARAAIPARAAMAAAAAGIACLAVPAPAAAQDFETEIGGFFTGYAAYADTDRDVCANGCRDIIFGQRSELHVDITSILDNGLEIGMHAEIALQEDVDSETFEGVGFDETREDIVDEAYAQVRGGFGTVQFGLQDGVLDQMIMDAPQIFIQATVNEGNDADPFEEIMGGGGMGLDTEPDFSDDFLKLVYKTPRIVGLQLGLSYTPTRGDSGGGFRFAAPAPAGLPAGPSVAPAGLDADAFGNDYWEAALGFKHRFDDMLLGLSAGYGRGNAGALDAAPSEWFLGAQLQFRRLGIGGDLILGAAYTRQDVGGLAEGAVLALDTDGDGLADTSILDAGDAGADWNIGAVYDLDYWAFQLTYADGTGGSTDRFYGEDQRAVMAAVRYALAENINLGLNATWLDVEDNFLPGPRRIEDNEGTTVFAVFEIEI